MRLGETLLEKRLTMNLTQTEVAEQLFVTRQTISNWENGKTLPDIESLIDLAHFYGLSLDEILLKGSDVVENLKKKEQLAQSRRWLIIPIGMLLVSVFLMYRAIKVEDLWSLVAISGFLFLLMAQLFFLDYQLRKIQRRPEFKLTKKWLLLFVGLILLGGCLGFLTGIYGL